MATKKTEPMDENLTLGQKLKIKVNEALDSEKDLDPIAAERVNQIVNDAIAGMPPETPAEPKPELAMAARTKAQIEAAVAAGTIPKELAAKVEGLLGDIETAYKAEPTPPAPAPAAQPHAAQPAPKPKS